MQLLQCVRKKEIQWTMDIGGAQSLMICSKVTRGGGTVPSLHGRRMQNQPPEGAADRPMLI